MAVSRVLLPRPPKDEDSSVGLPLPGDCDKIVSDAATEQCTSDFQALLEIATQRARSSLQALDAQMEGLQGCVFNPRFETSLYDSEDQDYHYPIVPDFQGKLLIKNMTAPAQRYGGEDQWSFQDVELWWSAPNIFTIKENAKLVINYFDVKVTFRAKKRRRFIGNFAVITEVFALVPFN